MVSALLRRVRSVVQARARLVVAMSVALAVVGIASGAEILAPASAVAVSTDTDSNLTLASSATPLTGRLPVDTGSGGSPIGAPPPGNQAPVITSFVAVAHAANVWSFEGTAVDDQGPGNLVINFGGIIAGYSAPVQSDGTFSFSLTINQGTSGLVSAQATDSGGLQSNVAQDYVFNN